MQAATLVFQTLRIGFPSAQVFVWGNCLDHVAQRWVVELTRAVDGRFQNLAQTSHDAWIENLLQRNLEGFWICDTDVVFTAELPDIGRRGSRPYLAGRFEPEFLEEWTGTRHMARLHTAVMWLDAPRLRSAMREWICRIPLPWRNSAEFDLVRQHFVAMRRDEKTTKYTKDTKRAGNVETLFYDTCAGLWHAIGGRAFTQEENAAFEHLHCATYVDQMKHKGLEEFHRRVYANPKAAAGAQFEQEKYYAERQPKDPFTVPESRREPRKARKTRKGAK